MPTPEERVRREIRNKVMQVAARDRAFAGQLLKLSAERMGRQGTHSANAALAQHAPDLLPALAESEQLSRRGEAEQPTLTREEMREAANRRRERQIDTNLEAGAADDLTIQAAAQRGMFDKARKAVGKLPDGPRKAYLAEFIDVREALSLVAKGEMAGAEKLAGTEPHR